MTGLTRRDLLLHAVSLGLAGAALARTAHGADACVTPESESLRESLNYTSTAADSATSCVKCAFFTAEPAFGVCGTCQILGGPVDAAGHCESFSSPA